MADNNENMILVKKSSSINPQKLEKIRDILSQYENGIQSILESSKKEDEENYLMLLFNCPETFHQKIFDINKSNSASFNYSSLLKFYGEIDKKKFKNKEIKKELENSRLNSLASVDIIEINIDE